MAFVYKVGEVVEHPLYERTLPAAGDDAYLHAVSLYGCHQLLYSFHYRSFGHQSEQTCFLVVHFLSLLFADVASLLLLHYYLDGLHTPHAFILVCVSLRHVYAILSHRLLPAYGMIGHRVVEYAVHVKKHSLGTEPPKAVLLYVFVYVCLYHVHTFYASAARRSCIALLSAS